MSKKLLSMAIAVLIITLSLGSIGVGAADYYEGSNSIAVNATNWSSNQTVSAGTVYNGVSGLVLTSSLSSGEVSIYLNMPYRLYSGCDYKISYYYTGNSATGRQGITGSVTDGAYISADSYYRNSVNWQGNASTTEAKAITGLEVFGFWGDFGFGASGWGSIEYVLENVSFYKDSACATALSYVDINKFGMRYQIQNAAGRPGFANFRVTEISPMNVAISGDGTVLVNGTAVANGAAADVETGAKVVVTFEPADGCKVGKVAYGGNEYQVNNNSITIDKAARLTDLSVTFAEDNDIAPLYESSFNVKDGIPSDWSFVSENYWNTGNKELVNKTFGTNVKPAVNMYNINPGAGKAASVFYAENKTGVKVHAGAKYDITYNWYSNNITSYNAPFISLGNAGFYGAIYKDGALRQDNIHSQDVQYETFGTNNASSYAEKTASYAISFDKINDSEDGEAAMTFGIKVSANARGDNVNYNGIAFGFYNLKIVESSPVSVASSNGSVSVNGTVVADGGKSAYIQTGAPVEFIFTPADGYEIKTVTYAGQTYDVKNNKLSIANHVVCADLVAEFTAIPAVAPGVVVSALDVSSVENKTVTYTTQNGETKTYTGNTIVAYCKLNEYNDGSTPRYGFMVTEKATGATITLECVAAAAPGADFGVRIIGKGIEADGEYTFVPVIIE